MPSKVKIFLEEIRLRTLPVSLSGVLIAVSIAVWQGRVVWIPAVLCMLFAITAQILSNLANEYYDYKKGIDARGRTGFARGVTEGTVSVQTLKRGMIITMILGGIFGLGLIPYGGWELIIAGVLIAIFAVAYSAGPFPLSHHGLGEVTVLVFYGLVPVNLTYYVMALRFDPMVMLASICIGLMGVNVLLVNNYRDADEDRTVGKRTLVVRVGRQVAGVMYLISGFMAIGFLSPLWFVIYLGKALPAITLLVPTLYLILHSITWWKLIHTRGPALNALLGETARNMLVFTFLLALSIAILH